MQRIDLTGLKFGRLLCLGYSHTDIIGNAYWDVVCDCGKKKIVTSSYLTRENRTPSCGCRGKKHGHRWTPVYKSWQTMKERCCNKNHLHYANYGGRGIKVCEQWGIFINFLEDMDERPEGKTLDRIDTNGDYTPENCRWATDEQQCNNKRTSRFVLYKGVSTCLSILAKQFGFKPQVIRERVDYGWDIEKALSTPVDAKRSEAGRKAYISKNNVL